MKINKKLVNISKIIKSKQMLYGISMGELAIASRVSTSTLYYHLRHPDQLRLGELIAISKKLHTPISELVGEIQ